MKLKDLKKLLESANDDMEIKVENGEIVISEPKIEYKFKIGDKVRDTNNPELIYTVIGQFSEGCVPMYNLKGSWGVLTCAEKWLMLISQDITERIKSFEDACKWCVENGKREMLHTYSIIFNGLLNSESEITEDVDDIIAYLKFRIITAALNEGWEPTFEEDEERWRIVYDAVDGSYSSGCSLKWETTSNKLVFKSENIAEYAAKQFRDIYADFCGRKKGGEK